MREIVSVGEIVEQDEVSDVDYDEVCEVGEADE